MTEKPFLVSGKNTIIHKMRKLDLLIMNGEDNPLVIVTHRGIKEYTGEVPETKRDAKMLDMELIDVTSNEIFSDEKTLLFVQTLNSKEYKIDYSKVGTPHFITIHQDSVL
ncbi:hypothetical protein KIH87_06685 [Paraneptunicella aestuarii]|uniref:hypothetical protein n=1 Tax=Paraneptunicella aestuarii TaxID=2831148 RepID=UPI001E57E6A8|nr:hypothetical protein [Paraneptunicella aestuarii]UAA40030.1 hypothetical protein KIH87_06685 [Paraneptunicella aestuarii]